jgi:phosphoribosyl 1,2-cyclic phosphodiesterase
MPQEIGGGRWSDRGYSAGCPKKTLVAGSKSGARTGFLLAGVMTLLTDEGPENAAAKPGGGMGLRFWGVRGSLPTPGPATLRYGGNTICVELRCGPHLLILDAGSGLREFGAALAASGVSVNADVLLSHTHLDHICGLPFLPALYDPQARLRFWGGHLAPPAGIADALRVTWRAPLMPDLDADFRAHTAFHDFIAGEYLQLHADLRVGTTALRHPGNSIGYRVYWGGASVCYITDTEHPADGLDRDLLRFVNGADILIYDASYTDAEYRSRVGWGHSTWQAGVSLADAAAVGQLVLFHHDPSHNDDVMDAIAGAAADRRPGTLVAREGMTLAVGDATVPQDIACCPDQPTAGPR